MGFPSLRGSFAIGMPQGECKMKNLYVASDGHDDWSGSLAVPNADGTDGPVGTLSRARDLVRELKASGGLPDGGVTVTVAGGLYPLQEPLVFSAGDGGTAAAPVVYRAAPGETVRLCCGMAVDGWRTVTDPAILARLQPEARGKVQQADLTACGISDFGVMDSSQAWAHSDPGLEVFFHDQPMTLARYPNEGFLHIASLSVEDGHHIRHTPGSLVGRFRVEGERARLERWSQDPGLMFHGYWFWDWADQRIAGKITDAAGGEITLDDRYPHDYGYRAGQWFYAFNLLCELDQPGEWYLDRDTGILYFWAPESTESDQPGHLQSGEVMVSVLRDPVYLENVSHLRLEGLTIEACRGTAIRVTGGESVGIAGCVLRNTGADGVRIAGGCGHTVQDCDVYQTGSGGIFLTGGDRRSLTPGGHAAVNNHIHHISRWNPLYKVGIQLAGCGNRAVHNRLHDLPHIAIGFTGNDQVVEYNEIYQAVTKANDAGAIYTAGAHPEDWTMRGHRVCFNYLHHLSGFRGEGCSGIYLDDMFSGTEIASNILYRVSLGFLLGGGRDIHSINNLFVDCPRAIHLDARAIGWASPVVPELLELLEAMPYREEPWASRYPELVGILDDDPALPKGNVMVRNVVWGGVGHDIEAAARPGLRMEDNLEGVDPCFVDEAQLDFRLRADSPAWRLGFEAIPIEKIGLQSSALRPHVPPRRLFEAALRMEAESVLFQGQAVRPGVLLLRVRNVGDAEAGCVMNLKADGARLEGKVRLDCVLPPFGTIEQRYELWPEQESIQVTAACDGVDGDLADLCLHIVDAAMPWPVSLRVSNPQPAMGRLETLAQLPDTARLDWHDHALDPTSHFCNVRESLPAESMLFVRARVRCAESMRVAVLLGYDGPVKLFVDGDAIFHDPDGCNPAIPDSAAPEVVLEAGEHELSVALGSNGGLAWGIFLRLRRVDLATESSAPRQAVLPVFL